MNRYQDEDWQQEEQRRREAYYRMNSQNSNTPDALEQIFRGPLNWMNLLMIGINVVIFIIMEFLGSTEDTGFMLQWGAACRPPILNGEWYRLFTSMFLHFGIYQIIWRYCCLWEIWWRMQWDTGNTLQSILAPDWWVICCPCIWISSRRATLSAQVLPGQSMELSVEFLF